VGIRVRFRETRVRVRERNGIKYMFKKGDRSGDISGSG
jgi:hypothetical protein